LFLIKWIAELIYGKDAVDEMDRPLKSKPKRKRAPQRRRK